MQQLSKQDIKESVQASKILSSEARLKILSILAEKKSADICVKEIAEAIGLSHSATSHQLAKLHDMGVVSPSRSGQTMCYSLTQSHLSKTLLNIMKELTQ